MERRADGARDILTLFFKHIRKIALTFAVFVFAAALLSFLLPPVYEASSSLMIKFGREYVAQPEVGSVQPFLTLNKEEAVNSEIQILSSRALKEWVVKTMGIGKLYPEIAHDPPKDMTPLAAAVLALEDGLAVEAVKKSSVVNVSFRHENPRVAAEALNLLVDGFKEKHLQVFSSPRSSFLEGQLASYRSRLQESADALETFKARNGLVSFDEQRTILIRKRAEADALLKETLNKVGELRRKIASLEKSSKTSVEGKAIYTQTDREQIIVEAKNRLLALQLKEKELLKTYREESRLVAGVREDIRTVRNFLKEQEEDISRRVKTGNVVYREVEVDLARSRADLGASETKADLLKGQLQRLDEELSSLSRSEKEYQTLSRNLSMSEKNYQAYAEKVEGARIAADMDRHKLANISVIHPAAVPEKPIRPKKALNLALGILLGAVFGLSLALCAEYFSQHLSTPEDVEEHLRLPVLAIVPYEKDVTVARS
jgi:uncharacterized protein involved in exopolysaccharide biosynthesis